MRDSLTALAILLIVALTAALVGPHLIDWNGHRALVERELSRAAGTRVSVAGRIDLELLPKPILRFGDVAVGGGGGEPRFKAESLDAELSLAALTRGRVQFVDVTLVRPELDLVQGRDGGLGPAPGGGAADRVALDHLNVRDGAIDVALSDGRHAALRGIDFDGEAASLGGPFKAVGTVAGTPGGRAGATAFRLATGALEAGRLRVKLHVGGSGARPSLDLDGVALSRPGALGPGFDGAATASGQVALAGTPAAVPWRVTAKLSADRDGATASGVELRAGADLRALIAAGDATADYAAGVGVPRAAVRLRGAALDADGLAVTPADSAVAPPEGADLLRALLSGAGDGSGFEPSTLMSTLPSPGSLRLDVDAAFDTATVAGRTALGAAALVRLGPEPGAAVRLSVDGPGGARVELDGRIEPEPPPAVAAPFGAAPSPSTAAFHGRAALRSADLRRTIAWLRPPTSGLAGWLSSAASAGALSASGAVDLSAAGAAARGLDLRLDGSALTGALAFDPSGGSGRGRVSADLSADRLDLGRALRTPGAGLPPRPTASAGAEDGGPDLDLSVSARALSLPAPALGGAGRGDVQVDRVAAHVTRSGDDLRLDRLAFDFAGARFDASASRDAAGGRGEVRVAAASAGPIVDALSPLVPAAAPLRARSALLSPLDATLRFEAAAGPDGALRPTRVALAGRVGGATVEAALSPAGPEAGAVAARDVADRPVALSLSAAAPNGMDLIRMLGLAPPGDAEGAGRLSAEGRGTLSSGFTGTVEGALGATAASYVGRVEAGRGAGRASVRSGDLRPLAAMLGLAPAGSATAAAELPGDAAGDLAWDGSAASWRGMSARVGGARVEGDLSLDLARRRGLDGEPLPEVRGALTVDRLPAEALLGPALATATGAPAVGGAADGPGAAGIAGSAWSAAPFAPFQPTLPRAELRLKVGDVPLRDGLDARGASLTLRTAADGLTLTDLSAAVAGGEVEGTLAIRRSGRGAVLSSRLAWRGLAVDGGGLSARSDGSGEVVGSGDSPAGLVASLAGTGAASLSGALARTDPTAAARVLASVADRDARAERGSTAPEPTLPDPEALRRDLAAALDVGPLRVEAAGAPASLVGGVLRVGPLRRDGSVAVPRPGQEAASVPWSSEAALSLDLRTLALATRVELGGAPGRGADDLATATRAGPLGGDGPRALGLDGLAAAVQAAAIARAQDRIDVLEQDIRERAAFNRQLKAAEQRRQLERERAEAARQAEAARIAAEAQARAAAARAAAQAAAEAQREAAEQKAEAARQRAEDARVQAQVEAAARAEAARAEAARARAERDEAEKQRFIDRALRAADPPLDGPRSAPTRGAGARDYVDPPPPPSIMDERGVAR